MSEEKKKKRVIVNRNPRAVSYGEAKTILRTMKTMLPAEVYENYVAMAALIYNTSIQAMEEN